MCGRYTITKAPETLKHRINYACKIPAFAPRYNIAPTQQAPVIVRDNNEPVLKLLKWGLIPFFARNESAGLHNINARIESLTIKPSFRAALKQRRCLIPADSFFEWDQTRKPKQPFRITLRNGDMFCFAGLWEKWSQPPSQHELQKTDDKVIESFTIITTNANRAIQPLHDRMPLIIRPDDYDCWLDEESEEDAYLSVTNRPFEEPLKIYPVSTLVNSTRNDSPDCLKPVEINRDFFENKWWTD